MNHGVGKSTGAVWSGDAPADGGEATAELALPRDQREVFGPVASTPTAWRLPAGIDSLARY